MDDRAYSIGYDDGYAGAEKALWFVRGDDRNSYLRGYENGQIDREAHEAKGWAD